MIKYFIFFTFLIFTIDGFSKQNPVNKNPQVSFFKNKIRKHSRNLDSLNFYSNQFYKYAKEKNDDQVLMDALLSMSNLERRKGNLKQSNYYLYQLITLTKTSGISSLEYPAISNLALNHRRLQRNDSAFYYFKKLYQHYSKNYNPMGMTQTMMNLGISHLKYQQLDSAEYFLSESIRGFQNMKQTTFLPSTMSLLAETYYQKEDYKKAIYFADSSLVLSKKFKMQRNFARNYSLLSRAYEKLGNTEKANYYKELESKLPIKIPSNAIIRGGINEKYNKEIAKRRGELYNKNLQEKVFYKTNLFIVILIGFILTVVVTFFYSKNKKIKKENEELQVLIKAYNATKIDTAATKVSSKNIILKSKASIQSDDILYIKSDGHYLEIYLKEKIKPEVDRNTMKNVLELLPEKEFQQIHRSYIVNINAIKILNSTQLMVINGVWIPLSRTYKEKLKEILNKK